MDCSYVITHRESTLDRSNNLNFVLKWVSSLDMDVEIILVEQDEIQKVDTKKLPKFCKHVFVYNKGLFNRSWGFNVGFLYSTAKAIAFADNDVIIDQEILADSFTVCLDGYDYDAIKPFDSLIDLTSAESGLILSGKQSIESLKIENRKPRSGISFCSAFTVFRRDAYENLGGFDERFEGWGGEDDAMSRFKIPLLQKAYSAEGTAFHLWHTRFQDEGHLQSNYQNNLKLLQAYTTLSKTDILELCAESRKNFGNPDKYQENSLSIQSKERTMKTLISFSSYPFRLVQDRLERSALPYFDKTINYTERDIEIDFFKKNIEILSRKRGFGYWLWKPYFILKTLQEIDEGDFCFYTDSSSRFVKSPDHLFEKCKENGGILLFDNSEQKNRTWTKRDCFILMDMDKQKYYETLQCSAGYQLYQKNVKSISFVKEFLAYCCNYNIVSDSSSIYGSELPEFRDHRHDQSVLSLLAVKHGIELDRDPSQWGNWHKSGKTGQVVVNERDALELNQARMTSRINVINKKCKSIHGTVENDFKDFPNYQNKIRVWASDPHVFTTQSIKHQLEPLNVRFYDYCLSSHWNLFYEEDPAKNLKVLNRSNITIPYHYEYFEMLSEEFKSVYYSWAQKHLDFFWCSFSTSMVHVVSKCDKTIILQLSFRYEGNLQANKGENIKLRDKLVSLINSGQLVVVASNEYDRQYFKYFTGIDVDTVPFCGDYLDVKYKSRNDTILIGPARHYEGGKKIINKIKNVLNKQSKFSIKTIQEYSGQHYEYEELCACKAIIIVPYTVYTGAIVEYLSMGIPMFFPSSRLLASWHIEYYNLVERNTIPYPTVYSEIDGVDKTLPDPNNDIDFDAVHYWMKFCEWYKWPIETFDSFAELEEKMMQVNFEEMHLDLTKFAKKQYVEVKSKWKSIIDGVLGTNQALGSK